MLTAFKRRGDIGDIPDIVNNYDDHDDILDVPDIGNVVRNAGGLVIGTHRWWRGSE